MGFNLDGISVSMKVIKDYHQYPLIAFYFHNLVPRAFLTLLGPDRTHNIGKSPGNKFDIFNLSITSDIVPIEFNIVRVIYLCLKVMISLCFLIISQFLDLIFLPFKNV